MLCSEIIDQVLRLDKVSRGKATHFVVCNGEKIRYLIDVRDGKKMLCKNLSIYSIKLFILVQLLKIMPLAILEVAGLGCFVNCKIDSKVYNPIMRLNPDGWNLIVGTYDIKQKIVFQCYYRNKSRPIYVKIGNSNTKKEMSTEISFLRQNCSYRTFDIPKLIDYQLYTDSSPFNVQLTEEISGKKVKAILTQEIVTIYQELSNKKIEKDGVIYEFSHGDFTPWNLRYTNGRFTLFDWEHAGYRIQGYDLMHYMLTIGIALHGKKFSAAYNDGMNEIKKLIPSFSTDRNRIYEEYCKTIRELSM